MFLPLLAPDVTPEATIRSFVAAFNARDAATMARRVVGSPSGPLVFPSGAPSLQVTLGDAKRSGDQATIVAYASFFGGSLTKPQNQSETVKLHLSDGDWRIVPLDPKAIQNDLPRPLASLAMITLHPEMATQARPASLKTQDFSKVKQIAIAVLMYAADHKDRLPNAKGFKVTILPYLRNAEVLTAPGAPKGTVSYFLDPRLSGMLITSIARPADTAMILEGTPAKTAFPWSGRTPVGYVDGHAKVVDATFVLKARTVSLR